MSKDDLVHENDGLTAEVARLKTGLDEVHEMLQKLEKNFVESKATFSLGRYGELKDMIKNVTSPEMMQKVHSLTVNQTELGKGTAGLLQKAKAFSAEDGAKPSNPHPKKGKISSFFKKIKDATGFSDADPSDIRCLDKEDIRKDNDRKRRDIARLNVRGQRVSSKLEKLGKRYQASKAMAPPTRHQEMKDMIKDIISDQKV